MVGAPSVLSLIAAGFYGIVVLAAILAWRTAAAGRQVGWHRAVWAFVAALFVGLAMARGLALEEWLRQSLRSADWIREHYEQRRLVQAPIIAALMIFSALAGWYVWRRMAPRLAGRRDLSACAALGSAGGLIVLNLVRIVSLHQIDALLYGPLKLNWVLDLGAATVVLLCAIAYVVVVRSQR